LTPLRSLKIFEKSDDQNSRNLGLGISVSSKKFAKLTTCRFGSNQRTVTKLRIFIDCVTLI